tara:strand:- start:325 stop:609 length:285 start_codon:yes stop_codon:yes gene_type:complete
VEVVELIESLGIPVAVACVLGYGCYYLIGFINGRLMQKLDEQAKRQEDILVTLINVQKKFTEKLIENNAEHNAQVNTLIELMKALTGNGLKRHE